jgi:hypothetical protein
MALIKEHRNKNTRNEVFDILQLLSQEKKKLKERKEWQLNQRSAGSLSGKFLNGLSKKIFHCFKYWLQ